MTENVGKNANHDAWSLERTASDEAEKIRIPTIRIDISQVEASQKSYGQGVASPDSLAQGRLSARGRDALQVHINTYINFILCMRIIYVCTRTHKHCQSPSLCVLPFHAFFLPRAFDKLSPSFRSSPLPRQSARQQNALYIARNLENQITSTSRTRPIHHQTEGASMKAALSSVGEAITDGTAPPAPLVPPAPPSLPTRWAFQPDHHVKKLHSAAHQPRPSEQVATIQLSQCAKMAR